MGGRVQLRVLNDREDWTPGEDALLAAGLMRFGTKVEQIRTYLLPARSVKTIRARMRLRTKAAAHSNCIKARPVLLPTGFIFRVHALATCSSQILCVMALAIVQLHSRACTNIQKYLQHSIGCCQTGPCCKISDLTLLICNKSSFSLLSWACRQQRLLCWDRCQ